METNSDAEENLNEEAAEAALESPDPDALSDGAGSDAPSSGADEGAALADPATSVSTENQHAAGDEDHPGAGDPLVDLADRALQGRLSPADEERVTALLKEALLGGKSGVERAAPQLPKLPWIVGVRAVEATWPEIKATSRTTLLKRLAEEDSDSARRVRLSLARALFKQDVQTALKIAVGVAKEMRDKETNAISVKSAHILSNVFIGKAKPWLGQIPLAEVKPADADNLVHCAVMAGFSLPHPPVTQLGILKWAAQEERLAKLHETAIEAVTKAVSRWSAKWQGALQKEVPGLPEEIASALKAPPASGPDTGEPTETSSDGAPAADADPAEEAGKAPEPVRKERPVYEPRPQKPQSESGTPEAPRERRGERPVYQPRNAPSAGAAFNLGDALRQIEAHVQSLRSELTTAQAKLRQREEDPRKSRRRDDRSAAAPVGDQSSEELVRLNHQLETRIGELQQRIDDLLADAEDRAASMGAHGGAEAVGDSDAQLRALLGLKLQEDYADFRALEGESQSVVVQQHYRSLLRDIFEILRREGVPFKE